MSEKNNILIYLSQQNSAVTMGQIRGNTHFRVTDRTVRRWLSEAASEGKISIQGSKRTRTYQFISNEHKAFGFLQGKTAALQQQILKLLRDLWTHNSTAIEGNTLTLGDTQFILDEGLTISGKPIKEHQEIIGHASAIELIYRMLTTRLTEEGFFDLHKMVQTEILLDIYKPYGGWKVEPNGTRVVGLDGQPIYIEYAQPCHVAALMAEVIAFVNREQKTSTPRDAIKQYTMIHAAIAHIHPFWDGNGRIARLVANLPLLKAGFLPIVIPSERRREYIQLLANYELTIGQLNDASGVWPNLKQLVDFEEFCRECHEETLKIIDIG